MVVTSVLGPAAPGRKDVQMPRNCPPYPPQFRRDAVELLRSGVALKRVAADLGVSEHSALTGGVRTTSTPVGPRV